MSRYKREALSLSQGHSLQAATETETWGVKCGPRAPRTWDWRPLMSRKGSKIVPETEHCLFHRGVSHWPERKVLVSDSEHLASWLGILSREGPTSGLNGCSFLAECPLVGQAFHFLRAGLTSHPAVSWASFIHLRVPGCCGLAN